MCGVNTEERANELLYDKLETELAGFIDMLCTLSADEVVVKAYEKVMKEDIVCYVSENSLSTEDCMKLMSMEHPLDAMYQEWLKQDITYMDRIGDCVTEFTKKLQ